MILPSRMTGTAISRSDLCMPFGKTLAVRQGRIVIMHNNSLLTDAIRPDARLVEGIMPLDAVQPAHILECVRGPGLEFDRLLVRLDEVESNPPRSRSEIPVRPE
jgi:hypothetical protein